MSARTQAIGLLMGTVVALGLVQDAGATLPADQKIVYRIHETPTDPSSGVVFTVTLKLVAEDIDGDDVAWRVSKATFKQKQPAREWAEAYPSVDTPDGLWWVTHADPQSPAITEFSLPPFMDGTATAQDSGYDDLDFEFEGTVYVAPPPPDNPPYGENTTASTYWFQLVGSSVAEEEGEDEPVEADEGGSE